MLLADVIGRCYRMGRNGCIDGGDSANNLRKLPRLQATSSWITCKDSAGPGQAIKAVNRVMIAAGAEAGCQVIALAEKLKPPLERLLSVTGAELAGSRFFCSIAGKAYRRAGLMLDSSGRVAEELNELPVVGTRFGYTCSDS